MNCFQENVKFTINLADLGEKKAIIIVPPTFSPGNICLGNAKKFLLDAQYVNLNEEKSQVEGTVDYFKRSIQSKEINFEIHSSVTGFSKSDWKRTVAVFVQGVDWEFNDWPKGETIISILLKVKGFYLKYSDMPTNPNVKKWNVEVMEIHRNKRHSDVSVQNDFWSILEDFLKQPRYREQYSQMPKNN